MRRGASPPANGAPIEHVRRYRSLPPARVWADFALLCLNVYRLCMTAAWQSTTGQSAVMFTRGYTVVQLCSLKFTGTRRRNTDDTSNDLPRPTLPLRSRAMRARCPRYKLLPSPLRAEFVRCYLKCYGCEAPQNRNNTAESMGQSELARWFTRRTLPGFHEPDFDPAAKHRGRAANCLQSD